MSCTVENCKCIMKFHNNDCDNHENVFCQIHTQTIVKNYTLCKCIKCKHKYYLSIDNECKDCMEIEWKENELKNEHDRLQKLCDQNKGRWFTQEELMLSQITTINMNCRCLSTHYIINTDPYHGSKITLPINSTSENDTKIFLFYGLH